MRRASWVLWFLCACTTTERSPDEEALGTLSEALTAAQVSFVTDAGPIGPATQHQFGPTLVRGAGGEVLVAWREHRNIRFTGSAAAIGEFVQSRVVALEAYAVTGQDDLRAASPSSAPPSRRAAPWV